MANLTEIFTKFDGVFRALAYNAPGLSISRIYSPGRKIFIKMLSSQNVPPVNLPEATSNKLWGIDFNCPVFNAAGMFKKAEGYYAMANQGAGAYLAGTTTSKPRLGNTIHGITHPFLPIPKSATAINWMGLPNEGHEVVSARIGKLERKKGCPIGISIATDPDLTGDEAIAGLLEGLNLYQAANVDFIEINESCPNVEHEHGDLDENGLDKSLIYRLDIISKKFLKNRNRKLPVILKFSNDTKDEHVAALVKLICDMGFDGVNFGNTSIQYQLAEDYIVESEKKKFRLFIDKIGGGVSGKPLKPLSLNLCKIAKQTVDSTNVAQEFHIIRTGGIETIEDIEQSQQAGVSLNQWFSGYFDAFAKDGNKVYFNMFSK